MAKTLDLRLYLVTDEDCLPAGVTLLDAVEQALQAGVTLVQYRENTVTAARCWPRQRP